MEFILRMEKTTKNTVKYSDGVQPPQGKSLYIMKSEAAEMGNPEAVKMTIEPAS